MTDNGVAIAWIRVSNFPFHPRRQSAGMLIIYCNAREHSNWGNKWNLELRNEFTISEIDIQSSCMNVNMRGVGDLCCTWSILYVYIHCRSPIVDIFDDLLRLLLIISPVNFAVSNISWHLYYWLCLFIIYGLRPIFEHFCVNMIKLNVQ